MTAFIASIVVAVSFAGCNKPSDQPITETTPEPRPPPALVGTPAPRLIAPVETPPSATPQPNYLAPEGVFFVIVATSIETKDGIAGFRPGTRAIKQPDGRYLADGHLVELRADQVTNDLRLASRIAGADQAAQAQIRKTSVSEDKTLEKKQQEGAQQLAASQQALMATNAQAAAQRQAKITAIRAQIASARQTKASMHNVHREDLVRVQEAKIRSLQQELSSLGVAGGMLE